MNHLARRQRARTATRLVAVLAAVTFGGCATSSRNHSAPRTLAAIGAGLAVGGSTVWIVGEQRSDPGRYPTIGLVTVAAGVAAMIVSGAWIAREVSCRADPDCDESEECREIPAPPGGVPYKQCMPR